MLNLKEVNLSNLGFFRFKRLNGKFLLTNDGGDYVFLSPQSFYSFVSGKLNRENEVYKELVEKSFINTEENSQKLIEKVRSKNLFLGAGPVLHILITTLRCNQKCVYCHASAVSCKEKEYDMSIETAKKVVDTIFCAPARNLTLEFQGGEPLLNWETVKFVVEYAREKQKQENKNLRLLLVSNFLLMDKEKISFLIKNEVSVCTSLDGPEALHNKNRGAYRNVLKNIKMAMKEYKENLPAHLPSAIVTISKHSLPYGKEIVDEYVNLGFEGIFIRPLNEIGYAKESGKNIDYSVEEYMNFYRTTLNYILEINKNNKKVFYEQTAVLFLLKMLTEGDPNFMDIRSPCGAGIGQIAYNYNGDVYTCDEGRMLAMMDDESFKMGNVHENTYNELIDTPVVKSCCVASCLDGLPLCSQCAYKPYCGTCPVLNYAEAGDIFMKDFSNKKCRVNMGVLDFLFERAQDAGYLEIFKTWIL